MSAAMLPLFSLGEWGATGEKGVPVKRVLWTDTPLIIDNETAKTPRRASGGTGIAGPTVRGKMN